MIKPILSFQLTTVPETRAAFTAIASTTQQLTTMPCAYATTSDGRETIAMWKHVQLVVDNAIMEEVACKCQCKTYANVIILIVFKLGNKMIVGG